MSPVPRPELDVIDDPAALAAMDDAERHQEAWLMHVKGVPIRRIAEVMETSRGTVCRWLEKEALARRSRSENIDKETERVLTQLEVIALRSLERSEEAGPSSMAGPGHTANALKAIEQIVKLRGIGAPAPSAGGGKRVTQVVVRIGGRDGDEPGVIDVGVRDSEGPDELEATG